MLRASLIFDVLNVYCVIDVTDKADEAHDKCVLHLDVGVNQCYRNPHVFWPCIAPARAVTVQKKKKIINGPVSYVISKQCYIGHRVYTSMKSAQIK